MDKAELERLRETIMEVLEPYQVRRVSLFGSVVRGEDRPGSDLDILAALAPPGERPTIGLKWFDLSEQLEVALERPVDLVAEDGPSPYIRPYVDEERVVLYEEDMTLSSSSTF